MTQKEKSSPVSKTEQFFRRSLLKMPLLQVEGDTHALSSTCSLRNLYFSRKGFYKFPSFLRRHILSKFIYISPCKVHLLQRRARRKLPFNFLPKFGFLLVRKPFFRSHKVSPPSKAFQAGAHGAGVGAQVLSGSRRGHLRQCPCRTAPHRRDRCACVLGAPKYNDSLLLSDNEHIFSQCLFDRNKQTGLFVATTS